MIRLKRGKVQMIRRKDIVQVMVLTLLVCQVSIVQAQSPEIGSSGAPVKLISPTGPIWQGVRVVDTFGWEHADVSIQWVGQGVGLQVRRPDGATKVIKAEHVRHIYSADGWEITAEVAASSRLGDQFDMPAVEDSGWANRMPAAAGSTLAELAAFSIPQLFSVAIDVGAGYASHSGTWFAGLDSGVNFQAGVRVAMDNEKYIRLLYRWQDFGQQVEEFYVYNLEGYGYETEVSVVIDISLREYQFLFGKLKHLGPNGQGNVGYFEFGLSIMEHRFGVDGIVGAQDSITKLGGVLQGGVLIKLNDDLALDLAGGMTWKSGFGEAEAGGILMGARGGLAYLF